jgi:capsular exopolysaccharide synthesis family protein
MSTYLATNDRFAQPHAGAAAIPRVFPDVSAQKEAPVAEFWRVLHKRRVSISLWALGSFALAAAFTFAFAPKFRSTATVQVNKESSEAMGVDDLTGKKPDESPLDFMVTLETDAAALKSDALALQVAQELNLERRPEFRGHQFWSDYFLKFADDSKLPLAQATHRRAEVVKAFQKNLVVTTEPGTRIIKVQFYSPDPAVAAAVANTLVNDYVERNYEIRYAATKQVSDWLSGQLSQLKNQVESSEEQMVGYEKQAGILGTDESHNIVMTRLQDVSKQLTDAESNRILAQAVWRLAQSGNPEMVSGLVGNSTTATSPTTMSMTLTVIQNLRSQEAQLKADYAQASTKYGPAYPRLIQMQNQIKDLDDSIQSQVANLAVRAQNDFQAAQQTENDLRQSFEQAKAEANQMTDSAVQYTIVKHEAESSRDLYDGLVKKFQEAGVIASLHPNNLTVWDPATPSDRPARPIVPLNLGIGLFGGLAMGVALAFFRESIHQTVDTEDQVESALLTPSLASVPRWNAPAKKALKPSKSGPSTQDGVLMLAQPHSHAAEAFRTLRACLQQMDSNGRPKVIMVTSAMHAEGKSTTSLNCAVALAQQGARVLLVEADLRKPVLKKRLSVGTSDGLSTLLKGGAPTTIPAPVPSIPNLWVVPAGPEPSNPAELLGSTGMTALIAKWRVEFDCVVIDTPPVLQASDALAISGQCDSILLVVRAGVTTKRSLARVRSLFMHTYAPLTGVVLNAINPNSPENRPYYGGNTKS